MGTTWTQLSQLNCASADSFQVPFHFWFALNSLFPLEINSLKNVTWLQQIPACSCEAAAKHHQNKSYILPWYIRCGWRFPHTMTSCSAKQLQKPPILSRTTYLAWLSHLQPSEEPMTAWHNGSEGRTKGRKVTSRLVPTSPKSIHHHQSKPSHERLLPIGHYHATTSTGVLLPKPFAKALSPPVVPCHASHGHDKPQTSEFEWTKPNIRHCFQAAVIPVTPEGLPRTRQELRRSVMELGVRDTKRRASAFGFAVGLSAWW